MTHIYTPKPLADYTLSGYAPASTQAEFNLVWLSMPKIDRLLNGSAGLAEFTRQDFMNIGHLHALSNFATRDGVMIADLMGSSPIAFVQDLVDGRDLTQPPAIWASLGGQTWIDTMMARAYQSAGMSDAYEQARAAANVVMVDFRAKRRC